MAATVSVRDDQLTRLVALCPGDGRVVGLVRRVCAQALSLPPLPAAVAVDEPESDAEDVIAEFAEQFSVDVSTITGEQRSRLWKQLGDSTFGVVVLMYIADFIPRVRAGLEALGVGEQYLGWTRGPIPWDHVTDPADAVFNDFLPAVADARPRPGHLRAGPACAAQLSTTAGCASRYARAPHWTPGVRRRCTTTSSATRHQAC